MFLPRLKPLSGVITDTLKDAIEIVFTTDNKVWDGRHINNGWLQEIPDPITSLTGIMALLSIKTIKSWPKKRELSGKIKIWSSRIGRI